MCNDSQYREPRDVSGGDVLDISLKSGSLFVNTKGIDFLYVKRSMIRLRWSSVKRHL